jgi:hypothetical protein
MVYDDFSQAPGKRVKYRLYPFGRNEEEIKTIFPSEGILVVYYADGLIPVAESVAVDTEEFRGPVLAHLSQGRAPVGIFMAKTRSAHKSGGRVYDRFGESGPEFIFVVGVAV